MKESDIFNTSINSCDIKIHLFLVTIVTIKLKKDFKIKI